MNIWIFRYYSPSLLVYNSIINLVGPPDNIDEGQSDKTDYKSNSKLNLYGVHGTTTKLKRHHGALIGQVKSDNSNTPGRSQLGHYLDSSKAKLSSSSTSIFKIP